jgi:phosphohistidine phosphatase
MKLYIMRHGPASDGSASGRDEDRPLTAMGEDRVRSVAHLLAHEGEMPTRIVSSSLLRAAQTADLVAAEARSAGWRGTVEVARELTPGGDQMGLVRRLAGDRDEAPMVVGHEPDLSILAERLLGAPLPSRMDKAMVVALELGQADQATLRFILEPHYAAVMHDHRGTGQRRS